MARYRYLLGDSQRESSRLRAQARLWDPFAHALFDRLRIRRGWRILEVGPGQGSLHLELRRRVRGPVDAVERSQTFASRLQRLCRRDGFGEGTFHVCDLIEAPLPRAAYDLIFARWVFLFLPDPEAHLRKLVQALKPGGVIALQDYQRETLGMVPPAPHWEEFLAADRAFFASQGGHASIGARLPALFDEVGLRRLEVTPEIKTGHPKSPEWTWLSNYFLGVMERYGEIAPFTPKKAAELSRWWRSAEKEPTSLLIAPACVAVVGRKPLRSMR